MKTSVLLDQKPVPGEGHLVRLLLTLEGDPPAAGARIPLNLSLVLDRSGSMAGPKLRAARKAAAALVRRLHPDDVVSVVAFDDVVTNVAEPARGSEHGQLSTRIEGIEAGGSTNLSGGWLRGREFVAGSAPAVTGASINRVLLLTDGQANVGIQNPDQLVGLCATANESGVTTTTIGFGADYDEDLLRRMAEAGGGATYYIERVDQAAAVFQEELSDLLDVAAQNLTVVVKAEAGSNITMVHHSYPSVQTPEGLRLELGDLYTREPRTVLVEMLVPPQTFGDTVAIATVTVQADVVGAGSVTRETITLPVTMSVVDGAQVDPVIEREALLQEAARVREQALADRDRGDHVGASERIAEYTTRASASGLEDPQLREDLEDLIGLQDVFAAANVSGSDEKYIKQRMYDMKRGRSRKSEMISRTRPPRPTE
jgi:Ca-activated chloride channel family protein